MVESGKEVCAIVKLKNRIDGHKATISEDYQRLKDIVTQNEAKKNFRNGSWKNRRKHTYASILTGENVISNIRDGLNKQHMSEKKNNISL